MSKMSCNNNLESTAYYFAKRYVNVRGKTGIYLRKIFQVNLHLRRLRALKKLIRQGRGPGYKASKEFKKDADPDPNYFPNCSDPEPDPTIGLYKKCS